MDDGAAHDYDTDATFQSLREATRAARDAAESRLADLAGREAAASAAETVDGILEAASTAASTAAGVFEDARAAAAPLGQEALAMAHEWKEAAKSWWWGK